MCHLFQIIRFTEKMKQLKIYSLLFYMNRNTLQYQFNVSTYYFFKGFNVFFTKRIKYHGIL